MLGSNFEEVVDPTSLGERDSFSWLVFPFDGLLSRFSLPVAPGDATTAPYPPNCSTRLSNTVMAHVMIDSCATKSTSLFFDVDSENGGGNTIKSTILCNDGLLDSDFITGASNDEHCMIVVRISDACCEHSNAASRASTSETSSSSSGGNE